MLNEKAKAELSVKDYTFLSELVGRGLELLTPAEKAHVKARSEYISDEALKGADLSVSEDGETEISPYDTMKADELKELCKDRGIEGATKKAEMIEALKADDNGELDGEENGEEEDEE